MKKILGCASIKFRRGEKEKGKRTNITLPKAEWQPGFAERKDNGKQCGVWQYRGVRVDPPRRVMVPAEDKQGRTE